LPFRLRSEAAYVQRGVEPVHDMSKVSIDVGASSPNQGRVAGRRPGQT
jgi:hypothetical protein